MRHSGIKPPSRNSRVIGNSPRKGTWSVSARRAIAAAMQKRFLVTFTALAANVIACVLDHAEHRDVDLGEHLHATAHVDQRDFLGRGGDDDAAVELHPLGNGELRISGSQRVANQERGNRACPIRR